MVQALHVQGWRVVQDVVYNHTFASGPHSRWAVATGSSGGAAPIALVNAGGVDPD